MLVGGLKLTMLFPYWISQLCGGLIGAALAKVGDPPGGWAGGFGSARAAGVRGGGEWGLSDSFPVASNGTESERVSCLVVSDSHDPMDCSPSGSSVHVIFPGKNTGVDCHFLLQGVFPTQELNPHLQHWQWLVDLSVYLTLTFFPSYPCR